MLRCRCGSRGVWTRRAGYLAWAVTSMLGCRGCGQQASQATSRYLFRTPASLLLRPGPAISLSLHPSSLSHHSILDVPCNELLRDRKGAARPCIFTFLYRSELGSVPPPRGGLYIEVGRCPSPLRAMATGP